LSWLSTPCISGVGLLLLVVGHPATEAGEAGPGVCGPGIVKPVQPSGSALGLEAILETNQGTLTFDLFPDSAPKTVARFSELVKKGFYNGLAFYRVVPKYLVQTGDPSGGGSGGSGQNLPAEFNERKHGVGTVGMARQHDPDSADSQFYICLEPQPFLDGKYTVFGQVIEGLELLPKIQEGDTVRKLSLKP
jgi:peptidylprolyl isomerase